MLNLIAGYGIDAVLALLMYIIWKLYPNYMKQLEIERKFLELKTTFEINQAEMWELIEGTVTPLSKRISSRVRRMDKVEQEDLKAEDSSKKKGGIIRNISQLKEYGFNRQA